MCGVIPELSFNDLLDYLFSYDILASYILPSINLLFRNLSVIIRTAQYLSECCPF